MSLFLALALAQSAQLAQLDPLPQQHSPEIEAVLRRRDERRRAQARQPAPAEPEQAQDDRAALAAVVPPEIAERLAGCLASANADAEQGIAAARAWHEAGGGAYADQCGGYALGKAERWAESASAFERGAAVPSLDAVTRARLWSQAGNAALLAGTTARALRAFDAALAQPLPPTLATGEIHLDRARARVAADDQPGARADLDKAIVMAQADPMAWLLSATLARRMNDLPLAHAHIQEAARRAGNDAAVALEEGVIDALSGTRDAAARAAFSRAKELAAPGSAIASQAQDYLAQLGDDAAPADGATQPPAPSEGR